MPGRDYIDFKIYLTAAPEGKGVCQVAVLPTPEVGEAIVPVIVGIDNAPRPDLLAQLASKSITLRDLAILGKQLAECLLPTGPARELFRDAYKRAGEDRGVRLRLIIADHTLDAQGESLLASAGSPGSTASIGSSPWIRSSSCTPGISNIWPVSACGARFACANTSAKR